MRSNILSVTAVTLACFFATVRADTWYAIYTNNNGFAFLDSNGAKIQTTSQQSVDEVNANSDKGERFSFPSGSGGPVVNAAHDGHAVGYDSGSNEFHADFAQNHFGSLVTVTIDGDNATFCNNANCIGAGGEPTTDKFQWSIKQIGQA